MLTVIVAIVASIIPATVIGWLLTRHSGQLQQPLPGADRASCVNTADLGLSNNGPTIVHFSAPWCGGCIRVRRIVHQVCGELRDVAHVELDMDANVAVAQQLSVRSLPTTFIFDVEGSQRYRATGIPTADDLRSALEPLLA